MKKVLLTVIAALTMCGSIFAQYESHWPDFYYGPYEMQGGLVAAIAINGQIINVTDANWDALEVAAFVSDDECRANEMYLYGGYVEEYGDPFPILDGLAIFYTNPGDEVYFKMYDHMNEVLYETCEVTLLGEPFTVITGDDNFQGWDDPENPIILNFIGETPAGETFTLDITGYGENEEGNWYLISSPIGEVAATDVNNMIAGTFDLYYFDQAQDLEWINYEDQNDGGFNLVPGKGYLYANISDVTLTFTGTPVSGDEMIIPLDYTAGAELAGWNLVGNPYDVTTYINHGNFYVMNENGTEIVVAETETVAPMEGIFVLATEEGQTLTFTTEAPNKNARLALNLICNNNVVDRAIVNFGKGTLPKFQLNPNSTKVYIPVEGEDFAVVSAGATGEMPVNFKAAKNGNYTLSFTSQEVTFTYLHLIDNMTGNDVNLLSTPSYNFDACTTDYASRFRLVFATGSSIDGDSFGFVNGMGNLCIFGIEGEATLQVVDVLGHVISSNQFSGSYESKLNVAPGTYMLRLIQGDNVMVQKMVIK